MKTITDSPTRSCLSRGGPSPYLVSRSLAHDATTEAAFPDHERRRRRRRRHEQLLPPSRHGFVVCFIRSFQVGNTVGRVNPLPPAAVPRGPTQKNAHSPSTAPPTASVRPRSPTRSLRSAVRLRPSVRPPVTVRVPPVSRRVRVRRTRYFCQNRQRFFLPRQQCDRVLRTLQTHTPVCFVVFFSRP